jgi:hypothetical protein
MVGWEAKRGGDGGKEASTTKSAKEAVRGTLKKGFVQ